MIEARRWLVGLLVDHAKFDALESEVYGALSEVTNARGTGGSYEVIVRWYSEGESLKGQDIIAAADELARVSNAVNDQLEYSRPNEMVGAIFDGQELKLWRDALATYEKARGLK